MEMYGVAAEVEGLSGLLIAGCCEIGCKRGSGVLTRKERVRGGDGDEQKLCNCAHVDVGGEDSLWPV